MTQISFSIPDWFLIMVIVLFFLQEVLDALNKHLEGKAKKLKNEIDAAIRGKES